MTGESTFGAMCPQIILVGFAPKALIASIANKDKFIWAVRELSETYEIDADLIEDDDGYTASLYMNYASYNGYIKKLLGLIFILSDDFSMFETFEFSIDLGSIPMKLPIPQDGSSRLPS